MGAVVGRARKEERRKRGSGGAWRERAKTEGRREGARARKVQAQEWRVVVRVGRPPAVSAGEKSRSTVATSCLLRWPPSWPRGLSKDLGGSAVPGGLGPGRRWSKGPRTEGGGGGKGLLGSAQGQCKRST